MYNTKFNSLKQVMELNKLTEDQLVHHIRKYFENQNYRSEYNKRKVQLEKELHNDPIVQKKREELKKKIG